MSADARAAISDAASELYLSVASIWEIAIKLTLKKLVLTTPLGQFMSDAVTGYAITILPITLEDCITYAAIAFPTIGHRDPFDRLIIAQATRNSLAIVSADGELDDYGVQRIW